MGRDQPDFPDYVAPPSYLIDSRAWHRAELKKYLARPDAGRGAMGIEAQGRPRHLYRTVDATMSHLDEAREGEEWVPFAERLVPVPGSGTGSLVPAICNRLNLPVIIDTGALST